MPRVPRSESPAALEPTSTPEPESKPTETPRSSLRRRMYRPVVLLVVGLIPMSVVVVSAIRRAFPSLSGLPAYRVSADSIDVVDLPPWVPSDLSRTVLSDAGLETPSLLDDSLVEDLAQAFAANAWVDAVESVRKSPNGRVTVRLEFRRPVAGVWRNRVSYPVDVSGRRLPNDDADLVARLPRITGVDSVPNADERDAEDPVVAGAARLAEALGDDWEELGVAEIRLSRQRSVGRSAEDLVYELVTAEGSVVVWGRAPGSKHPGELSVKAKLGKLSRYLAKFDSFDAPNGPYEIDIRHWREITRRRLAGRPGAPSTR